MSQGSKEIKTAVDRTTKPSLVGGGESHRFGKTDARAEECRQPARTHTLQSGDEGESA
jgi:hypothetical protein